jgi:hypothetical protein
MTSPLHNLHVNKRGKVSDKWESYLDFYDERLSTLRNSAIDLLEIGVQNGGSLETWSEYFKAGRSFVGVDINPKCENLSFEDPRISVIIGDAKGAETRKRLFEKNSRFDVIIDDGSHTSQDIILNFLHYFPALKPNGLYFIEDTHTLYWGNWGGGVNNEASAYSFFKKVIDLINLQFWTKEMTPEVLLQTFFVQGGIPQWLKSGWIKSVEFQNSMILIKKCREQSTDLLGKRLVVGELSIVDSAPLEVSGTHLSNA